MEECTTYSTLAWLGSSSLASGTQASQMRPSSLKREGYVRRADRSRPGNVVALDFFADGFHLVIDAVVTTVNKNTEL
jgi:hypothetical protein